MALVNLGDIKTAVKALGWEADQDARIVIFANSVQRAVLGDHRYRFMLQVATLASVPGTIEYTLPNSPELQFVESIRLNEPSSSIQPKLTWLDSEQMLELANASSLPGLTRPYYWTDDTPAHFQVYPAPTVAGTYTVRYLAAATELVADADVPVIPHPYLDIIVFGVAELLSAREGRFDYAQRHAGDKQARIAAMKSQYGLRQRQSGRKVIPSGRYGGASEGDYGAISGGYGYGW